MRASIWAFVLRDAVHLVNGDSASFVVAKAGLRVLADPDMLAVGPVHRDPARHTRFAPPIWTPSWFPALLFFWRAVDTLARRDVELWRVGAQHPRFVIEGVGTMPPESVPYSVPQRGALPGSR